MAPWQGQNLNHIPGTPNAARCRSGKKSNRGENSARLRRGLACSRVMNMVVCGIITFHATRTDGTFSPKPGSPHGTPGSTRRPRGRRGVRPSVGGVGGERKEEGVGCWCWVCSGRDPGNQASIGSIQGELGNKAGRRGCGQLNPPKPLTDRPHIHTTGHVARGRKGTEAARDMAEPGGGCRIIGPDRTLPAVRSPMFCCSNTYGSQMNKYPHQGDMG